MTHIKLAAFLGLISVLSVSACAERYDNRRTVVAPGHYEHSTNYVDDSGTRYENRDSTEVRVDKHGRRHTSVKSKSTRDPKGLFNKKTTHESDNETNEQR